jgi:hypothetical protein
VGGWRRGALRRMRKVVRFEEEEEMDFPIRRLGNELVGGWRIWMYCMLLF